MLAIAWTRSLGRHRKVTDQPEQLQIAHEGRVKDFVSVARDARDTVSRLQDWLQKFASAKQNRLPASPAVSRYFGK